MRHRHIVDNRRVGQVAGATRRQVLRLIRVETVLLLEFLIIAFGAPPQLAASTTFAGCDIAWQDRQRVLGGSSSSSGHSINNHSLVGLRRVRGSTGLLAKHAFARRAEQGRRGASTRLIVPIHSRIPSLRRNPKYLTTILCLSGANLDSFAWVPEGVPPWRVCR